MEGEDIADEGSGQDRKAGHNIIFPEIRLASPLVNAKGALIQECIGFDCGIRIEDDTPVRNLRAKIQALGGVQKLRRHLVTDCGIAIRKQVDKLGLGSILDGKSHPISPNEYLIRSMRAPDPELAEQSQHCILEGCRNVDSNLTKISHYLGLQWSKFKLNSQMEISENIQATLTAWKNCEYQLSFCMWNTLRFEARKKFQLFDSGQEYSDSQAVVISNNGHIYIIGCTAVLLINLREKYHTLMVLNDILCAVDVTESRMLISGYLGACNKREERLNTHRIWQIIDDLLLEHGDATFELIGFMESLIMGSIIGKGDPVSEREIDFLENQIQGCLDWALERKADEDKVTEWIIRTTQGSVEECGERMSLFRTWGHPAIESSKAAAAIRKHMCKTKMVNFGFLIKERAYFAKEMINGYARRHAMLWPPVTIPSSCTRILKIRGERGFLPSYLDEGLISELTLLDFDQWEEVSLDDEISIFMKDKAVSGKAGNYYSNWQYCTLGFDAWQELKDRRDMSEKSHKRLISYFLDQEDFNPQMYIDHIESGDYIQDRESYLSYSLKEREIKTNGRIFGKMDPKTRGAQVLGEHLVAHGICKYQPENTMVLREDELTKRINYLNSLYYVSQKVKGTYPVSSCFLGLDIVKYCLNQRLESNSLIFRQMDRILGLKSFMEWHHKYLLGRVACVADPFFPPKDTNPIELLDQPNEHIFIRNCAGGVEGYQQKAWTSISITDLNMCSADLGFETHAIAQGDNQVIGITSKDRPELSAHDLRLRAVEKGVMYKMALQLLLLKKGQKLKMTETYISHSSFVYSKRMYFKGRVLPQSQKAVISMKLWGDKIVDETRSGASNISTGVMKTIAQGGDRVVSYTLGLLRTSEQLMNACRLSLNRTNHKGLEDWLKDESNLLKLSITPSMLGGMMYMSRSKTLYRNPGDPLSHSVLDMKDLIKSCIITEEEALRLFNQPSTIGSWRDLCMNPYGLSIYSGISITTVLEKIAAQGILSRSKNPMLKGLFSENFKEEDEEIARSLLDNDKVYPRTGQAILSETPAGERNRLCKMCNTTKTVIMQGAERGGLTFADIDRIKSYDKEQLLYIVRVILGRPTKLWGVRMVPRDEEFRIQSRDLDRCIIDLVRKLRDGSWRYLIGERRLEGLDVAVLPECSRVGILDDQNDCIFCMSGNKDYAAFSIPRGAVPEEHSYVKGIRSGYVGSCTQELTRTSLVNTQHLSRPVKRGLRMTTLIIWMYGDTPNSWDLALKFANMRFPVDIDTLKLITPRHAAGNMLHRLHDRDTNSGFMPMKESNLDPFISMSTDHLASLYDLGSQDTNLIYQNILHLGTLITESIHLKKPNKSSETLVHIHIVTGCCVREQVFTHMLHGGSDPPEISNELRSNRFIYDPRGITEIEPQLDNLRGLRHMTAVISESDTGDIADWMGLLTGRYCVDAIIKKAKELTARMVGLDENTEMGGLMSEISMVGEEVVYLGMGISLIESMLHECLMRECRDASDVVYYLRTRLSEVPYTSFSKLSSVLSSRRVIETSGSRAKIGGPNALSTVSFAEIQSKIAAKVEEILEEPELIFRLPIVTDRADLMDEQIMRKEETYLEMLLLNFGENEVKKWIKFKRGEEITERNTRLNQIVKSRTRFKMPNVRFISGNNLYVMRECLRVLRERNYKRSSIRRFEVEPDFDASDENDDGFLSANLANDEIEDWSEKEANRLRQKGKDFRVYLLRGAGVNSTAGMKIWRLVDSLDIRGKDVICLGEGSGCIASVLIKKSLVNHVYFNSLMNGHFGSQRNHEYLPSEMSYLVPPEKYTIMGQGVYEKTDLTNDVCIREILKQTGECSLVTCDVEAGDLTELIFTGVLRIVRSRLVEGGTLLVKLMMNQAYSVAMINTLGEHFTSLRLSRTPFADPGNSEFYLIAEKFTRSPRIKLGRREFSDLTHELINLQIKARERTKVLIAKTDAYMTTKVEYEMRHMGWEGRDLVRERYVGHLINISRVPFGSLRSDAKKGSKLGSWARVENTALLEAIKRRAVDMKTKEFLELPRHEIIKTGDWFQENPFISHEQFCQGLHPKDPLRDKMPPFIRVDMNSSIKKIIYKSYLN